MGIFIIVMIGVSIILLGIAIFRIWFNPLSLYAGLWTLTIALFQTKLINYYPLEFETWMVIANGFFSFVLGILTIYSARFALTKRIVAVDHLQDSNLLNVEIKALRILILILSSVALLSAARQWYVVLKIFGSVKNVLIYGNLLYANRVKGDIQGGIPYLGALANSGMLLAGRYTALSRRFSLVSILPMIAMVLSAIAEMGRSNMLLGGAFLVTGYVMSMNRSPGSKKKMLRKRWQGILIFVVATSLFIGTAELVRSSRKTLETIHGATQSLQRLNGSNFITPSVYEYVTVHPGVLNQYLKLQIEHTNWGENTFGPIYRLMSKFGFDTYTSLYMVFYRTPIGANTGTYLKEIHADFGIVGTLVFPYLLGILSTWFWHRQSVGPSYLNLVVISHLLGIIVFSFFMQIMRTGVWWASLVGTSIPAYYLDIKFNSLRKFASKQDHQVWS